MNNILGFIGGSGLYDLNFLDNVKYHDLTSSFGPPSDKIIEGSINGNIILTYMMKIFLNLGIKKLQF